MCASPFVDTKQEDVEEGGTVKDAVPAYGDEEDDDKRKCCIGCHRNARTGRCFVRPDEEAVAWAFPSGRGCWCRDCYNVWRLRFSQKMPLATMSYHLKQNTTVITEFEVALVSYISLRRNGSDRVSGPALAERMELVEWIAGAFGMPLRGIPRRADQRRCEPCVARFSCDYQEQVWLRAGCHGRR